MTDETASVRGLLSTRRTPKAGVRFYVGKVRVSEPEWLRVEHERHMALQSSGQGREMHEKNASLLCPSCVDGRRP